MIYVVDVIGDICKKVSEKLKFEIHYQHGHPVEIIETLQQREDSTTLRFKKYPAIFLFQDFTETMGELGIASNAKLHILIVAATDRDYKASQRYEKNFKPTLYPIYFELLNQIFKSGKVMVSSANKIIHTKMDRLFWGRNGLYKNDANVFNDYLDAIEITDLQLKFYQPVCLIGCATNN